MGSLYGFGTTVQVPSEEAIAQVKEAREIAQAAKQRLTRVVATLGR